MILSSQGYWWENSIPAREGPDSPDNGDMFANGLSCWEKQLGNLQCLSPKHEGFLQMFASTNSGPATIQGFGSNFFFFCWNLVLFLITRYGSVSKPCTTGEHQKIAGKWMFIPLKMVSIGIDPYPYDNKSGSLKPFPPSIEVESFVHPLGRLGHWIPPWLKVSGAGASDVVQVRSIASSGMVWSGTHPRTKSRQKVHKWVDACNTIYIIIDTWMSLFLKVMYWSCNNV